MAKITIMAEIDPPDCDHCLNPKSRRRIGHCKFMNWAPQCDTIKYSCDVYRRRLRKRKDGTI